MESQYKIAVLMSTYNGEKYIECQLESILGQQLPEGCELQLLIRDDGSTDNTTRILIDYEKKDSRIKVYYGENIGYISSFIELLQIAKEELTLYDYYAFSDQDDQWDLDKLKVAVKVIGGQIIPFLYQSTTRITDSELNFIKVDQVESRPITFYNAMVQTFSPGHTYVFNKSLLECVDDNLDCGKLFAHDSYIHNLAVIKGTVFFDRNPHNNYRQHCNNVVGVQNNGGLLKWIIFRIKKIGKGDGRKYARQMYYFMQLFGSDITDEERKEIADFFEYQSCFVKRLVYVFRTKFYRQTFFETLAFKLLYLLGGYNYSE